MLFLFLYDDLKIIKTDSSLSTTLEGEEEGGSTDGLPQRVQWKKALHSCHRERSVQQLSLLSEPRNGGGSMTIAMSSCVHLRSHDEASALALLLLGSAARQPARSLCRCSWWTRCFH